MKKKEIIINTKKDLEKLYKKLFLYKSFFYKNITFTSSNKKIKEIIEALNIKTRKKRIIYIYDTSCKIIDDSVKGKNVCGFKNNKCYTQQKEGCKYINGCCRRCLYQNSKGCSTSNLTCKFFYCSKVKEKHRVLEEKDINLLRLLSFRQKEIIRHNYFSNREEIISDLYIGSIAFFTIRYIFRQVKRIVKLSNKK